MSLPKRSDIAEYWKVWLKKNGFELGEPSCWACKRWWDIKYDTPILPGKYVSDGWDKIPLQRCHIIPKSLGGSDELGNLFLMCKECHDHAPNTASRDVFFKWVSNQDWSIRVNDTITSELMTFDFTDEDSDWVIKTIQDESFKEWANEKIGLHGNQQGYGIKLTISTLIGVLFEYRKLRAKEIFSVCSQHVLWLLK